MPNGIIPFITGLGLPQILLWVLTFAVTFGVLSKLKILSRAPAALISIAVGFMVLMAVPGALITVIAGMSTGLVAVAIGLLVLLSLIEVAGAKVLTEVTRDGKKQTEVAHPFTAHGRAISIVLMLVAVAIFIAAGGLGLIGWAIPAFSWGTWLLIIVGAAVLWMLSEA